MIAGTWESGDEMDWTWTFHGKAVVETVEEKERCKGEPLLELDYRVFQKECQK